MLVTYEETRMESETVPPAPSGSRPSPLVWPFELARTALAAMQGHLDELGRAAQSHDAAGYEVGAGWEGRAAHAFAVGLGEGQQSLVAQRRMLADDIVDLERAIARAQQAERERAAAIADWDQQMRAHLSARGSGSGGVRAR